jgi:alkylation response protein AidB-like acyl-CoA dehydrogenase
VDFERDIACEEEGAAAHAFARREIAPSLPAREQAARCDREDLARLGRAGLFGALLPREHGGSALGCARLASMQDGFGAGAMDAGLALAWSAHLFDCALPVARYGSEGQRGRYSSALARGDRIGALAHAERDGGPTGVATRARAHGDHWILEGEKQLVANAPLADLFVVSAITDAAGGARGVSTFLIERDAPGFTIGARVATHGLRTACFADVVLERCEVPKDAMLGELGAGLTHTLRLARLFERALGLGAWIGISRTLLEASTLRLREANGGTPALRARLTDMRIDFELAQRAQRRVAHELDSDEDGAERDVVAARLCISRAMRRVVEHAVEIDGVDAIRAGGASERLRRDAQVLALAGESEDLLRSVLAGALLGLG